MEEWWMMIKAKGGRLGARSGPRRDTKSEWWKQANAAIIDVKNVDPKNKKNVKTRFL